MPFWLVDDPTLVYLLLGVVAIGLLVGLWFSRDWRWRRVGIVALAGAALLALGVFLLDLFVVTDSEMILDSIAAMRGAVQRHDSDGVMKHVAKDFQFQGLGRDAFGKSVDHAVRNRLVDDVNVWDFDEMTIDLEKRTAGVAFKAKPTPQNTGAGGLEHYLIRATFVMEADGQWRLKTFQVFNPFVETGTPVSVPLPGR